MENERLKTILQFLRKLFRKNNTIIKFKGVVTVERNLSDKICEVCVTDEQWNIYNVMMDEAGTALGNLWDGQEVKLEGTVMVNGSKLWLFLEKYDPEVIFDEEREDNKSIDKSGGALEEFDGVKPDNDRFKFFEDPYKRLPWWDNSP